MRAKPVRTKSFGSIFNRVISSDRDRSFRIAVKDLFAITILLF